MIHWPDVVPLESLSELDVSQVRSLWMLDWYDGPLDAIVVYAGKPCRLVLYDANVLVTSRPWTWLLFSLSPEEWVAHERSHALFLAHVGGHGDTTGQSLPLPSGRPEKFYDVRRATPMNDPRVEDIVGYLTGAPEPLVSRTSA